MKKNKPNNRSLCKLGKKNPMYGKHHTKSHKDKQSKSIKKYFTENPEKFKLKALFGKDNPKWVGDKIGRCGVHDWIRTQKGLAKNGECKQRDKTCKGRLEWSNISQKYLRKLIDWQILCLSHHRRYDKHTHTNGLKTRFKKGQIPWNKK